MIGLKLPILLVAPQERGYTMLEEKQSIGKTTSAETKSKPKKKKIKRSSAAVKAFENELITIMGTKVRITHKGSEGSIEIEYYSDEDFERVMDLLRTIQ